MCVCIVCVYVCIHVMRVVRLPHKLTYCFFPFSWVDPTHSGGGGPRNRIPGSYILCIIYYIVHLVIYDVQKLTSPITHYYKSLKHLRAQADMDPVRNLCKGRGKLTIRYVPGRDGMELERLVAHLEALIETYGRCKHEDMSIYTHKMYCKQ